MLSSLYDLGLGAKNRDEFAAYRILMFLHGLNRSGGFPYHGSITTDSIFSSPDLNLFVGQLTSQQKSNPCVLHALNVQRALSMGNYHLFFSLYNTVPNMGGYIMDHFVERERIRALLVMTKSYVSQRDVLCRISTSFPMQIHLGTYGFHRQRTRIRDRLRNT